MLSMHLPKGAVAQKMVAEGLDASVLDMDPEKPLISGGGGGVGGGGGGQPRTPPIAKRPRKISTKPEIPLRPLFWTKIPDDDLDGTIWNELSDESVEVPLDDLTEKFAKTKPRASSVSSTDGEASLTGTDVASPGGGPLGRSPSGKVKAITLLDGKVLQNVGIALAKFRMSATEIKQAVLSMDETKLDLDTLMTMLELAPTAEDLTLVKEFEGDPKTLGKVEQFFLGISDIPQYVQRLECFIFKLKFDVHRAELAGTLDLVGRACSEVRSSAALRSILKIVLKLGNMLNGGTGRGGSYGYRLDSLSKLATIKSLDNKQTLVHHVAALCKTADDTDGGGLLAVASTMPSAEAAGRVSLSQWSNDFKAFQKMLALLDAQIGVSRKVSLEGDLFAGIMEPFLEAAKQVRIAADPPTVK